jgi:hypothetical protein
LSYTIEASVQYSEITTALPLQNFSSINDLKLFSLQLEANRANIDTVFCTNSVSCNNFDEMELNANQNNQGAVCYNPYNYTKLPNRIIKNSSRLEAVIAKI